MHQCCEQCFLQKNIREYINNRRRIGNCCYCGRKNVAIAQTREVGIFIRESLDKEYEVLGEDTGSMYDSEDDMYIDRYGELKQVCLLGRYYLRKKIFLIIMQERNNYLWIYF